MNKGKLQISEYLFHTFLIGMLFIALYMLSYSGTCHSYDEVTYTVHAQSWNFSIEVWSLLKRGDIISAGNMRLPFLLMLRFINDLSRYLPIGVFQAMYLINIISSAIVVVFIFLIGIKLGYSRIVSISVACILGLTSPLWVYSKSLFREPFSAMFLTMGLYFLITFKSNESLISLIIAILSLLLSVTTRLSTAAILPFVIIYIFIIVLQQYRKINTHPSKRYLNRNVIKIIIFTILGIYFSIWGYKLLLKAENNYMGYLQSNMFFLNVFKYRKPIIGLLVSPGRGLIFYYPPFIFSIIGAFAFTKRHTWESMLIYLSFTGYLIATAHYTKWWGGLGWGPRYLVPFIPYISLSMLPFIDFLISHKSSQKKRTILLIAFIATGGIIIIGFLIQLIGVTVGTSMLIGKGSNEYPASAFNWKFAPIIWQMLNIVHFHNIPTDIAWMHLQNIPLSAFILTSNILIIAIFIWIIGNFHLTHLSNRQILIITIVTSVVLMLFILFTLQEYYWWDTRYKTREGYPKALAMVKSSFKNGDILLIDTPLQDNVMTSARLLNFRFCEGTCPSHHQIGREIWAQSSNGTKKSWMAYAVRGKSRAWLIPTNLPPGSPLSQVEQWMDIHYFKQGCTWTGKTIRVCLYYLPFKGKNLALAKGINFEDKIKLIQADMLSRKTGKELAVYTPGASLLITLQWTSLSPMNKRYKITLQLLDSNNKLRAQLDREIGDGFWPTSGWGKNETLKENYALTIPANIQEGKYTLYLGVYDPGNGARLIPQSSQTVARMVKLTTVKIEK